MKKLGVLIVTLIIVVLFAASVSALDNSGKCGKTATYTFNKSTGELIIDGTGAIAAESFYQNQEIKNVIICDGITEIGIDAFNQSSIENVSIPDSVVVIGDNSFAACDKLIKAEIPDSVISIGEYAFSSCCNLASIYIGDSVSNIGNMAFNGCTKLMSVKIPDSVINIGGWAFLGCTNLKNIDIGDNVTSIGNAAFSHCTNLTTIKIPDSVTDMGYDAFYDCESLVNVYIGIGLKRIENYSFYSCDNIKSIDIPNNIASIGRGSFAGCNNLENVKIGNGVTEIGRYAFQDCSNLRNIEIGNNVFSIGQQAFFCCSSLQSINVPKSVTLIELEAFRYCTSLYNIYYEGSESEWNQINIGEYNTGIENATIHFQINHSHSYDLSTKTPTCSESGTKTYTCTCGDTYTETIPATNHPNATTDEGKAPTTTEPGYTEGKYCPDCKTWIEGHTEIPKLEEHKHSYAPTTTQEATCWREGVKTYTCSCGDTYTEAIAKLEHEYRPWETKKKPTCTEPGLEWSYCLICDNDFEREIPAEGHNEYAYTRRATPDEAGAYVVACDKCWIEFSSVSFGRPAEYKLSTTTYTYNGKAKTPKLTVTTSDGKVLKKGVDYTVELPKDRTSVGTHTYRVVFMGDYLGETKVSYQILPGKTSSVSASQSTDYIKLSWKKVTGATGYRVYQYNSSTGKYKTLKTLTGTSYTVKNLKAGTTYKFAVKAYTKADGETLWAASSKTLTTATKPATPTVKATAGAGKVTLSWSKVTGATGYVIYMMDEFGDYEKVGSTKGTSYSKKSLKKGKTHKFRVKAYKKVDGKYIYSGYKTYSVKVK